MVFALNIYYTKVEDDHRKGVENMIVYKSIEMLENLSENDLKHFASLFSNKQSFIEKNGKPFLCIPYNPDTYYLNQKEISIAFEEGKFQPLVVTNYKFLALLLWTSKKSEFVFTDFSFKEDGEEAESEKTTVQDMISEGDDVKTVSDFLKDNSQKIQYIELCMVNQKNKIRIFSNGNIALSNSFDKAMYSLVTDIVEFLFTGNVS